MSAAISRPPAGLLLAGALAAALVLLPVGVTIADATGAGWRIAAALLGRGLVAELLANTLALVVCTSVCCGVLGVAAAWFIERTDLPGRRLWAVLVVVPLAIPAFVTSFAWVSLTPRLQDFSGALLVVTLSYYPLVYLPVAAALREMDPALEETARALGNDRLAVFLRVILPQLRPALFGGMLLVALNTLVEFGAFSLLRFRTFTTAIYSAYRAGFSGAEPALLAVILVLLCLVCLVAEYLVRGRARYGRLARGSRRGVARYPLGWFRILAPVGFALFALLSIGVPLGMICYWLTQSASAATTIAAASLPALAAATGSSIGLACGRYDGWLVTALERTAYLAQSIPGIVIALALVSLTVHHFQPLYQSYFLLMVAYTVVFLPLALVSIRAAILQAQPRLEETGRSLGLGWIAVLFRVTLPLAAPGLGAAAAMVFIAVLTELTATLLLAPIGTQTLATQIWANTSSLAFAAAAPYAALMGLMSLTASWALARRFGAASVRASI
jgi:iron(III) transport system permease protein